MKQMLLQVLVTESLTWWCFSIKCPYNGNVDMQESKIPHLINYFFISLRPVHFSSFFNNSQRPHWPHLFSHSRHSILCSLAFSQHQLNSPPSHPRFRSVWMCLVKLCLVAFYSLFFASWSPICHQISPSLLTLSRSLLIRWLLSPFPPSFSSHPSLLSPPPSLLSSSLPSFFTLLSCSVTVLLFHVVLHPSLSPHLFTRLHLIFSLF